LDVILPAQLESRQDMTKDGMSRDVTVQCRIDTPMEIDYYKNGRILQTVLRSILERSE
jgi:aconitate hydratase